MVTPESKHPPCPRCGSIKVTLCGQSVQYRPEDRPEQPLSEREVHTSAYQCECGLGFTVTQAADAPPDAE